MAGNTLGDLFRITTWGESHGEAVGVTIDGAPAGIPFTEIHVQAWLDRRKPGGGKISTSRKEPDTATILSGTFEGKTTGTPITIVVENQDAHSGSYVDIKDLYRPGHGDITYDKKYGIRDYRGGGRASARETVGRVAAAALACEILKPLGVSILAATVELGGVRAEKRAYEKMGENPYLCPDAEAAEAMDARVDAVRREGDSLGGVVEIIADGVPAGLGEPVFEKLDAALAGALMGIGAVKGVEIGAGFDAARMTGSENNDPIIPEGFSSNHAGGVLAGISNGAPLVMRVAVKPIPSITREQVTLNTKGEPATIRTRGRHDVSAIPRVNVVCEAMVALVLADHFLRQRAVKWTR
ncbi:chorismate synthase [Desulfoluna sp.]|uniref:chorismate synthase n=1 Tax=Desulfoluna sp. TaxID=2045199 RepID=UPI0026028137|nr:chorismate synthase [Desulfoluna sp.]